MIYRMRHVEAMQYTGDTKVLLEFLGEGYHKVASDDRSVIIATASYQFTVMNDSYVQKTVQGPVTTWTKNAFEQMYEPVPDEPVDLSKLLVG